jgi:tetratricopeptide (TPR) repeat protein
MQKLHRFSAALSLLNKAAAIALESPVEQQPGFQRQLDLQYIIIKLARNNTDQALSLLKRLKASSKGAAGAADLAVLFAAVYRSQGLLEAADAKLAESLEHWDRITPFTVAWVSFQRGELWVGVDDARAETRYEEALHYLPEYVTLRVHLAELKKRGGDIDAAIKLLKPIAEDQDPEPAGRLSEFLEAAGENKQSLLYREIALRGWELLLTRYPLTFADHAAEFWLAAGANPELALEWAAKNYKNQPTSRAKTLLLEATLATENLE